MNKAKQKIVKQKLERGLKLKKLRNKFTKTSFYKGPFQSVSFYFRKYKVMIPFSKDPITFGREQVYNT